MTDTLRIASSGPEVGNWQRFLNGVKATDPEGKPLVVDETFGTRSFHATRVYQTSRGLTTTGFVDALTRKAAIADGFIPFVPAKNQSLRWPSFKTRPVDVVVMHTMEAPETSMTAENVAAWFGGVNPKYPPPKASAHYCVDNDSVIQCVRESDVAWHAPGANHNGIGVEMAGFAKQTKEQWEDEFSLAMLRRAACLVARLCREHKIPVTLLTPEDLKAKKRGLCGHDTVTKAFGGGTHWDPGPWFPWDTFLMLVAERV